MKKTILHVPHASTEVPFYEGYIVDKEVISAEILKITDWYTDDLFASEEDIIVKAPFSRVFCDVERFSVDSQEIMSKFGMGVLYEKNDAGDVIRNINDTLRQKILQKYYWVHHHYFTHEVNHQLSQFGSSLIVDCHSYPSIPIKRDLDQNLNRPDFNIGTDSFHTPSYLVDTSVDFFNKVGYSLGVDYPYKGAIVPLDHYQKNQNVHSIMLEINRKLYLNEPTNEKSEHYQETKSIVFEFLQTVKKAHAKYSN
jgi:N-formylglutamate amidohydrolase